MFLGLVRKVFGTANDRIIKGLQKPVRLINDLEPTFSALSDDELKAKTGLFKERLQKGETLDDLLPEAFAAVREASKRVFGMRHFDVQLMGGIILHRGMISEMRTGEGKTLMATLPVYLNALTGKGVHVVTVNDYLATRDSQWMGQLYQFLGLSVGCIVHGLTDNQRRAAYGADITYGTNNEFGFDYLRDNMKFHLAEMAQREFHYAIVDEVDSILVDEARTPLIISGPAEDSSDLYRVVDDLIPLLEDEDYEKDEKGRSVTLTEKGIEHIEAIVKERQLMKGETLYDIQNVSLVHHINQSLKAHKLFSRDVDYIVKDNKVIIIDEFTGRMMEGRRYSDGLHQAIEAKEHVDVQQENQTLASITFQNYFRMYSKLAGMTGTALTEAAEFSDIYKLEVVDIPTNRPVARKDYDDEVYRTQQEKFDAICKLIEECTARQQPVLVGTVSIEKSELLSQELKKKGIAHNVLNARHHEREAHIIAEAGAPGAVTIATNMAGRGTDIKLGGNAEMRLQHELVGLTTEEEKEAKEKEILEDIAQKAEIAKAAGGLYVIGTERHESRRIDNQLRGRSGRQGDPGASKFFLSLEDDLMRIFGSERLDVWLRKLGMKDGEAITHPWVNRALEKAQQKVEARNYDIRKHLLKYDDVMNDQRKIVYEQRREVMDQEDISEFIEEMRQDVISTIVSKAIPENSYAEQWAIDSLQEEVFRIFGLHLPLHAWAEEEGIAELEIRTRLQDHVARHMAEKEERMGAPLLRMAERNLLLRHLDQIWKDHLHALDHLRQGINLRAYGQRDPLNEYKREAFSMFQDMLDVLREKVVSLLSHFEVSSREAVEHLLDEEDEPAPVSSETPRNAPCPCGSGLRFKECHGKLS